MTVEATSAPFAVSPLRRAIAVICFAGLLAAVLTDFVSRSLPSPLAIDLGLAVGAAFGVAMAWEARDGGMFSMANPRIAARAGFLTRHAWLRIPLMGLFVFGVMYETVAEGAGGLATALIGQPGVRTTIITGTSGGGKSCHKFDVRGVGFVVDHALCASSDLLARAQPGRSLVLRGKVSPFGFNVAAMSLGPPVAIETP
ncbi:MAG: hypothetical protein JSR98_15440 [Proteobacteria bacterium]|nr:hypothetical protein [Pseudomonadota bacterium]